MRSRYIPNLVLGIVPFVAGTVLPLQGAIAQVESRATAPRSSAKVTDPGAPSESPPPSADPDRPKRPIRVTISKETTWITAPLREDGYPDYVRYLNEKLSEGITPENNAMVPLARTMGLLDFDDQVRTEYCKLLGIEPPPKDGDYFEPWSSYIARTPEAEQPRVPPGDKRLQKDHFAQLVEEAASRPWTSKEFPHVAKWLEENNQHLDAFDAASNLPRSYSPLIVFSDDEFEHPILVGALTLDGYSTRDGAEALCCRAMLRTSNNDSVGAANDLLAAHRLAAHVAVKPHLACFMTAKQIECSSRRASIQLCARATFSRKELTEFRSQYTSFPTIPTIIRAYDLGARFEHLDATCYIAREGWHVLQDVIGLITDSIGDEPPNPRKKWPRGISTIMTPLVRWDEPLKLGNEWYDRLVRITRIDDPNEQTAALDSFDDDLQKVQASLKQLPTQTGFYFYPRTIPTRLTSSALIGSLVSTLHVAIDAGHHLETYRSMFDISMALCEYRADQKEFPDTLEKLVPEYIERIPVDDFNHRAFVYRKTDAGFVLYSLGKNGRDDGGKDWNDDEDADDVMIQVPARDTRIREKP